MMVSRCSVAWLCAALLLPGYLVAADCPFHNKIANVDMSQPSRSLAEYNVAAVQRLDLKAVKADLKALMTDSQAFWPADFGHYGGLMIRLAWHCAGSYRRWDGRGGCDGARQRFEPEQSWADNTNLDKARKLLVPIKQKYGDALSWGDLITLAGSMAIESMGGPYIGFCAGRIDDKDGTASEPLGPTASQRVIAPCIDGDGKCEEPLGQTTLGLIYVNPEGVMANPVPELSVAHIRSTFARMGMNDSETVALIGGGHAFGKTHGACPTGPGPSPKDSPKNPWPGTCGSGEMKGKGPNAFTAGFEGSWTTVPTEWSNQYFKNLIKFDWEKHKSPGNHWQWRPKHKPNSPDANKPLPDIMMLTSDVALTKDPVYLELVKTYAEDMDQLTHDFGHAWYKLMTRDVGPVTRCIGSDVSPVQEFQMPLPPPPAQQPCFAKVRADIVKALNTPSRAIAGDSVDGQPYYGALFSTLAWQCASTFRQTDYFGGCNGARIRFPPQSKWPANKGLDKVLQVLHPVKAEYATLTYADLIVLAGTVAVDQASGSVKDNGSDNGFSFCPGRADASDGKGTETLAPRNYSTIAIESRDNMVVQGLYAWEWVALAARPRSPVRQQLLGYSGSWTTNPSNLTNDYFKVLLGEDWQQCKSAKGLDEYKAIGKALYMIPADIALKQDKEFSAIAKEYAADNSKFVREFTAAWTKVMNADRFDGPAGNVCNSKPSATKVVGASSIGGSNVVI